MPIDTIVPLVSLIAFVVVPAVWLMCALIRTRRYEKRQWAATKRNEEMVRAKDWAFADGLTEGLRQTQEREGEGGGGILETNGRAMSMDAPERVCESCGQGLPRWPWVGLNVADKVERTRKVLRELRKEIHDHRDDVDVDYDPWPDGPDCYF